MKSRSAITRVTTTHVTAMILLVVALLLSSCGFHLREALQLPTDLGPLKVVAKDPNSQLVLALKQAIERSGTGAVVAADDATDVATLNVSGERWGNTPISVDQYGRAQEFTLRYAVFFNLRRADGTDLVPQQAIEIARDYVSVPTLSAGTESERELLAREMRRDMVASILRRIGAVLRMPVATPTPAEGTDPPDAIPAPASHESPPSEPAPTEALPTDTGPEGADSPSGTASPY